MCFGTIIKNMNNVTLFLIQYNSNATNLAMLYLAYGLKGEKVNFNTKIYPWYRLKLKLGKLYSYLADSSPILAVGCWSDALPYVLVALERVKRKFPQKTIILGGVGPSEAAEDIMRKFKFVDFVIKGCGVKPLPELIKKINSKDSDFSRISGLVYRLGAGVKANANISQEFLLNETPDYNLVKNIDSVRKFHIRICSGCPYECTYCRVPGMSERKVFYRDIKKVIEEIKLIKRIKNGGEFRVVFNDEAFVLNRKMVLEFCDSLIREGLKISWTSYGRVDRMDEELLKKMSESGCSSIYYGVESGSNRILKIIKKGFTVEDAVRVIFLTKKYIKEIRTSFICLYPFETKEEFIDTLTLKAYLELNGIITQLHMMNPVKGSLIFEQYKKNLRLYPDLPSTFHEVPGKLPKKCLRLVRNNPEIFYTFYLFDFKDIKERISLIKSSRATGRVEKCIKNNAYE